MDSLHEEVRVLQSIDHPNVIKLYDFYEEPKVRPFSPSVPGRGGAPAV